jgi:hypothetical protein
VTEDMGCQTVAMFAKNGAGTHSSLGYHTSSGEEGALVRPSIRIPLLGLARRAQNRPH